MIPMVSWQSSVFVQFMFCAYCTFVHIFIEQMMKQLNLNVYSNRPDSVVGAARDN